MPRGLEEGGVAVATGDQLVLISRRLCRSWGKVRVDGGGGLFTGVVHGRFALERARIG